MNGCIKNKYHVISYIYNGIRYYHKMKWFKIDTNEHKLEGQNTAGAFLNLDLKYCKELIVHE